MATSVSQRFPSRTAALIVLESVLIVLSIGVLVGFIARRTSLSIKA